jgi:hypothetical protein
MTREATVWYDPYLDVLWLDCEGMYYTSGEDSYFVGKLHLRFIKIGVL